MQSKVCRFPESILYLGRQWRLSEFLGGRLYFTKSKFKFDVKNKMRKLFCCKINWANGINSWKIGKLVVALMNGK